MDNGGENSLNGSRVTKSNTSRKGPLSCAECRRLKIKCDLNVLKQTPCSSCERRGCGVLCPDNTLKTGKGTRYILSGTEELHKQVEELKSRIKELENALEIAHALNSGSSHPLLGSERYTVPPSLDSSTLMNENEESKGPEYDALIIGANGQSQWLGFTALSEVFVPPEPNSNGLLDSQTDLHLLDESNFGPILFDNENLRPSKIPEYRQRLLSHLPNQDDMCHLISHYYEHVGWNVNPVPRSRLSKMMVPLFSDRESSVSNHELSIIFHILALGSLMDVSKPADHKDSKLYGYLARVALSLSCIFTETTVASIEALILRTHYLTFTKDHFSTMKTWAIQGLSWKLIQSLGMHRDPARWKFSPEECTRRRRVFWDFVTCEVWKCLAMGRPSSLDTRNFDCKIPQVGDVDFYGEDAKYHSYKWIWTRDILLPLLNQTLSLGGTPSLKTVTRLDRLIREKRSPLSDLGPFGDETQSAQCGIYQRNFLFCIKEVCIMFLHRPFFISALHENQPDVLRSPFASSVLAVHASASALMGRGPALLAFKPQAVRYFIWWVQGFSAATVLGALVIRNPGCELAGSALAELDLALKVYEAAKDGFRPAKVLPALTRLNARAHAEMDRYIAGKWTAPALDSSVIPGMTSGVQIHTSGIFHPADPKTDLPSGDENLDLAHQESVEIAVAQYLHNLEKEMQYMTQNGSIGETPFRVPDSYSKNATVLEDSGQDVYLPPQSLLDTLPAPLPEEFSTANFDSTIWANFVGQLGFDLSI